MRGIDNVNYLLAGAAVVAIAGVATPAAAQERSFNVEAGPANKTVPIFAKQAGIQIIGRADELRGKRTNAVKGRYTVEDAMGILLAGTELDKLTTQDGIVTIGVVRRTQVANTPDGASAEGIAEILVIGSRSLNVDIKRTEDDDQPYVVFDAEDVRSSQATSVEDFLRTRLPQNTAPAAGSNAQVTGSGSPFSSFNLRGLGSNQTLILVNGRRLPSLANGDSTPNQADINGIPISSIERIEVLPSSASGIYGGNAVGGVINIILKSDYRGIEIGATYNDSFDFVAPDVRLELNGGFALEGGRTTVTFGGAISRASTLRVEDRLGLLRRGVDLYRGNVDIYAQTGNPPRGNGVNVRSVDGSDLVLRPEFGGTNLGSNITNAPLGYGGVASDNGATLIANAGTYNLDVPNDLNGLKRGLRTAPEMLSFNASVRREFTDWLDLVVDFSHFENEGTTYSVTSLPDAAPLAAGAENNPFTTAVNVSFPNPGYEFPFTYRSSTDALTGGAIVRLPHDWAANLQYSRTWSTNQSEYFNAAVPLNTLYCLYGYPAPFCQGGTIDPFQAPIDYGSAVYTDPTFNGGPYESRFDNPSLRLSGPLFALPGGKSALTLAVQREETNNAASSNRALDFFSGDTARILFTPRMQRTDSAYGELVLPLVSPKNDIPFVNLLELRGAVRHDSYLTRAAPYELRSVTTFDPDYEFPAYEEENIRFDSTNFTLAGRYSPVEGIVFRGSYATGFLPPSIVETGYFESQVTFTRPDPLRGNSTERYTITAISGLGSENLKPETSETFSAGVILTPVEGLRISADYTQIKKEDEIGVIPYDYLLANPDLFPGRVVREEVEPGAPAGYAGRIVSIDQTPTNLFNSEYRAWDFQADYTFDLPQAGRLRLYGIATYNVAAEKQIVVAAPSLDYVDNLGGPLEWQGNAGLDWEYENWNIRWNTQFYDGYNVFSTQDPDTPTGQQAIEDAIEVQGARRIPSQSYSDLFVSYKFDDEGGILGGVTLSAGIQNFFNQKPPAIAVADYGGGGYSRLGDPRLRRFSLSLRKSFGTR